MPGPFDDERHAPGVLVEVLLALQAVAADRHAVVGGVEDVGVVEFAHRLELLEDAADLDVDVFAAGELAAEFVADRALVALLPDAADGHFVAQVRVAVVEGMRGQVVDRQRRLLRVRGRAASSLSVWLTAPYFASSSGLPSRGVVRMGEAEVDEERIGVLGGFALARGSPAPARACQALPVSSVPPRLVASWRTVNCLLAAS